MHPASHAQRMSQSNRANMGVASLEESARGTICNAALISVLIATKDSLSTRLVNLASLADAAASRLCLLIAGTAERAMGPLSGCMNAGYVCRHHIQWAAQGPHRAPDAAVPPPASCNQECKVQGAGTPSAVLDHNQWGSSTLGMDCLLRWHCCMLEAGEEWCFDRTA